jgi:beta-glucosidase
MTLREKCRMLAGADGWRGVGCERLGIAPLVFADGPHGLRKQTTGADCLGFGSSILERVFLQRVRLLARLTASYSMK